MVTHHGGRVRRAGRCPCRALRLATRGLLGGGVLGVGPTDAAGAEGVGWRRGVAGPCSRGRASTEHLQLLVPTAASEATALRAAAPCPRLFHMDHASGAAKREDAPSRGPPSRA